MKSAATENGHTYLTTGSEADIEARCCESIVCGGVGVMFGHARPILSGSTASHSLKMVGIVHPWMAEHWIVKKN